MGKCRGGSTDNSGWMYTGLLFSIYHRPDTDVLQLRICDSVDPMSGDCHIWSGKHLCTPSSVYHLPVGKCDDPFEDCGRDFCDKMFRVDFPKKKREQSDKVSVYSFFDRSGIQYSVFLFHLRVLGNLCSALRDGACSL